MLQKEKLLINEIKKGNQAVFENLFHQYYKTMVMFAEHFLLSTEASEDIVQTVFIYLWENSKSIRIEKSLHSYLFQAVKNRCLNYLRSLKIRDENHLIYLEALLRVKDENIADSEMFLEINKALQKLPKQMYDIFCKKYFGEQSVREIATELSISENTVKVQLFNGRNKIREILKSTASSFFSF